MSDTENNGTEYKLDPSLTEKDLLFRCARELTQIRQSLVTVLGYMRDAESEVHEKMRRFVMYFHDIHDLNNLYHEFGLQSPDYIRQEMERCADRFRQLLEEAHEAGGVFEKVKREMASDQYNRYDHTKLLSTPKFNERNKE